MQSYRPQPIPIASVVERIRYFQSHFRIGDDNTQTTENLLALIQSVSVGGKQIHDANIVATMQTNGISHVLTYNTGDFARFSANITVWSPQDVIARYTPPT